MTRPHTLIPVARLKAAHLGSIHHRPQITASDRCGCFYCRRVFPRARVIYWIDEDPRGVGRTALCPYCGIDAVLGSAAGYPLTAGFLNVMHDYWFETKAGTWSG